MLKYGRHSVKKSLNASASESINASSIGDLPARPTFSNVNQLLAFDLKVTLEDFVIENEPYCFAK
jgi:hypothetical protein